MFFKREKTTAPTFDGLLDELRSEGFQTSATPHGTLVRRAGFGAILKPHSGADASIESNGLALGDEVAVLTDVGFQKIFLAPSGRKTPALAEHLKGLHAFVEDLRETLGLTSLYNEGLGTINEQHIYDRVEDRDSGAAPRPWERKV